MILRRIIKDERDAHANAVGKERRKGVHTPMRWVKTEGDAHANAVGKERREGVHTSMWWVKKDEKGCPCQCGGCTYVLSHQE